MGKKVEKIKINEIWKIKQDIDDFSNELSSKLAIKAEENMVGAFKSIIEKFYSYDPKSYKRKNGGELDDVLVNHHTYGGDNKYRATIKIGSDNMSNSYRTAPQNILNLMWVQGVRGLPERGESGWINPFWSGESKPYENIFKTNVNIDGYEIPDKKVFPHYVLASFIHKWGDIGRDECDKIVKSII